MKFRFFKRIILGFSVFSLIFSSCTTKSKALSNKPEQETNNIENNSTNKNDDIVFTDTKIEIGDKLTITRALAAKMISLAYDDKTSINLLDKEINFKDLSKDSWDYKYINFAVTQGYMHGIGDDFKPNDPLTIEQAQSLIDRIDKNNPLKVKLTDENKNKPVSLALWTELYKSVLEHLSAGKSLKESFNIEEKNIIILATPKNNANLTGWNLITDNGPLTFEGIDINHYIDKEIKVLLKDNEIVSVLSLENEKPTIKNSFIVSNTNESITIFSGGVERTYKLISKVDDLKNKIANIQIENNTASIIKVYDEKISSIIKKVDSESIELKDIGVLNISKDAKIYSIVDGSVKWKSIGNLTVGTDIAYYVVDNSIILSAVITKTSTPKNIRVVLSTTGFSGLYHSSISLTGTEDYTVTYGENVKEFSKDQLLNISTTENADLFSNTRIYIKSKTNNGKIAINSIKKNGNNPKYRATIEIAKTANGYVIINELSMEEYLYAVVPSEMPTAHGLEAAKVQAVTARSYAYNQYYENKYHKYGANVDDSVNCQVYNNTPETDISIKAVNETEGQCLTSNGKVISANFFSTSSGSTANSGEVWANSKTKEFPTTTSSYLSSKKQYSNADFGDLAVEVNADKFFKTIDIDSFDRAFAWFRWNTESSAADLSSIINKNLKDRYNANPTLIKTLQADGVYRSKPISSIGTLKDIEVMKRSTAGNLMQIKLVGTNALVMVYTEYNIRNLLKPQSSIIYRHDGSKVDNYSLLPSSFFAMDKTFNNDGTLQKIKFFGGGNGHGVGMSQNGVKGMIDKGFKFEEIIKHYYEGTEIETKL